MDDDNPRLDARNRYTSITHATRNAIVIAFVSSILKARRLASLSLARHTIQLRQLLVILAALCSSPLGAQEMTEEIWHLDFQRRTQITNPHLESPQLIEENGSLWIGAQHYELRLPNTTEAYSTETKTLVTLDHLRKEHTQMPMHANIWFLNSETVHRNALCQASQSAELSLVEMEPCSRFDLESLFSFAHPQAPKLFNDEAIQIAHYQKDKEHVFENKNKIAVRFVPSAFSMDRDHGRMFRRFLAHLCKIHPEIRREIIDLGFLPSTMSYRTREGATEATVEYRFENIRKERGPLSIEIPAEYKPRSNDARLETILSKLESRTIPKPEELMIQTKSQIEGFLADGSTENAVLAAYRFYGITDSDPGLRELLTLCGGMSDRYVRRLVYSLGDIREVTNLRDKLQSKGSPMAYLLNYYLGDLALAQHRDDDLIYESLIKCLEEDELIVGAYIDLSRRYMQAWDPYTAWRCIQAARRISPNHSDLIPINILERAIERDSPDFF
jgi:hypothetical protein